MALHDPVEDALNDRKKRARLVEAGAAIGTPDRDALDVTRQFLGGGSRLPPTAAPTARRRAFGQQGTRSRPQPELITPPIPFIPPTNIVPDSTREGSLSDQFFNLPGPVGFSRTPQGRSILQRILGSMGRRRA